MSVRVRKASKPTLQSRQKSSPHLLLVGQTRLYVDALTCCLRDQTAFPIHTLLADDDFGETAASLDDIALILMDVPTPSSATVAVQLRRSFPGVPLVALADDESDETILGWASYGVAHCLCRDTALAKLVEFVQSVDYSHFRCSDLVAGVLLRAVSAFDSAPLLGVNAMGRGRLTRREREILTLISERRSNKQIAATLGVRLPTVKNHVRHIYDKLGIHRRDEAMIWARLHSYTNTIGDRPTE